MTDLWDDVRANDFGDDDTMGALIAVVGLATAKRLVEAFGGDVLYVPKLESVARNARNRRIHKEFTGANHRDLAERYNLTVAHVHNILRDMRQQTRGRDTQTQMELF